MNGEDVAVIRNDIKHLVEKFDEQRVELRDWQQKQEACHENHAGRIRGVERVSVESKMWREGHVKEHDRISTQLRDLRSDVKKLLAEQRKINGNSNGASRREQMGGAVAGGAVGGISFIALIEAATRLIEAIK